MTSPQSTDNFFPHLRLPGHIIQADAFQIQVSLFVVAVVAVRAKLIYHGMQLRGIRERRWHRN